MSTSISKPAAPHARPGWEMKPVLFPVHPNPDLEWEALAAARAEAFHAWKLKNCPDCQGARS
jgi:hypothetical protein